MVYFSLSLPSKSLNLPQKSTIFEALCLESKFVKDTKSSFWGYIDLRKQTVLENYFLSILKGQFVVITGDLNRDRFKKEEKGEKVLCDLERIHNLENLIRAPSTVTTTSQMLGHVLMTNRPELFMSVVPAPN